MADATGALSRDRGCAACASVCTALRNLPSPTPREARAHEPAPRNLLHADLKNAVTLQQQRSQTRRKLRAQAPHLAGKAPPPFKKVVPPPPAPLKVAPPPPAPRKPGAGTVAELPSAAVNDALLPQMRNMNLVSATAAWTAARSSASMSKIITCVIDTGAGAAAGEALLRQSCTDWADTGAHVSVIVRVYDQPVFPECVSMSLQAWMPLTPTSSPTCTPLSGGQRHLCCYR